MNLTERITHDIADAMRAREQTRLSALRMAKAALRTARERHVITYVDEKTLMFTFQTGRSSNEFPA